jgi:site-specific DNA-methyltransferase (adenine-specific)
MSNSCQKCGNKSTKGKYVYIQAHHKRPFALFPEERFAIDNGHATTMSQKAGRFVMPNINIIHGDCMQFMRDMPDRAFELAIVDPPYGLGDKFRGGKTGKMQFNEVVHKGWDIAPSPEYFDELYRVSKNQIIWGGNYFSLPPSRCFIIWHKLISEVFSLSMAELAWTSFDALTKIFRMPTPKTGKQHPTQKPVSLYQWLLKNYAKQGDKILDTHLGSGSSAIAADIMGFDFCGYEIDIDYYNAAVERFNRHKQQLTLDLAL